MAIKQDTVVKQNIELVVHADSREHAAEFAINILGNSGFGTDLIVVCARKKIPNTMDCVMDAFDTAEGFCEFPVKNISRQFILCEGVTVRFVTNCGEALRGLRAHWVWFVGASKGTDYVPMPFQLGEIYSE